METIIHIIFSIILVMGNIVMAMLIPNCNSLSSPSAYTFQAYIYRPTYKALNTPTPKRNHVKRASYIPSDLRLIEYHGVEHSSYIELTNINLHNSKFLLTFVP